MMTVCPLAGTSVKGLFEKILPVFQASADRETMTNGDEQDDPIPRSLWNGERFAVMN